MVSVTKKLVSLILSFAIIFINIPEISNIVKVEAAEVDFTQGNLKFIVTDEAKKEVSVQAADKADFSGINSTVIIPETVTNGENNYKVTSIAEKGFEAYYTHKKSIDITSVYMPNTIVNIGYMAFAYCENLEKIKLSKNLQTIDENVFYFCTKLEDLTLSSMKNLPDIGCDSLYKANEEIKIYVKNNTDVSNAIDKYNNVKPSNTKRKDKGLGIELNTSNVLVKEIIEIKNVVVSNADIWTKGKTVSFDVDPKESTVKDVKYEYNGNQVELNGANNHYSFEVSENGVYKLIAEDSLENTAEYEVTVNNIDNEAPTINYVGGNPTQWQNDNVVVRFRITDNQSGIESVICEQGVEVKNQGNDEYSLEITANGSYTLVATDKLGNASRETITVDKLDKESPNITYVSGNPAQWQKDDAVITLKVTDSQSGIKSVICEQGVEVIEKGNSEYSLAIKTNGVYTIVAEDNAGNISKGTITVDKLDKEGPVISEITGNPVSWQKGNATINFKVTDVQSGVSKVECSNGRAKIKLNELGNGEYCFTISVNGNYVITAVDNVGNETTQEIEVNRIDNTAPSIENINGNPTKWQRKNADITFNVEDLESGVKNVSCIKPNGEVLELIGDSGLYEFEADMNGIYKIIAVDNMGNTNERTITVDKLEFDKPEISKISGNPTKWQTGSAKISFEAFDNTSGLYKVTVVKDDEEEIKVSSEGEGLYTFEAKTNGVYKITVMDFAGNTTSRYVNVKYIRA